MAEDKTTLTKEQNVLFGKCLANAPAGSINIVEQRNHEKRSGISICLARLLLGEDGGWMTDVDFLCCSSGESLGHF